MSFLLTLSDALARAAEQCDTEVRLLATAPPAMAETLTDGAVSMPCASVKAEGPLASFLRETRLPEICLGKDLATAARRLELDVLGPSCVDLGPAFPVPWCAYLRDLQHRQLPALFAEPERAARDAVLSAMLANSRLALVDSRHALADIDRFQASRKSGTAHWAQAHNQPLSDSQRSAEIQQFPRLLPRLPGELPTEATVRTLFGLEAPYIISCSRQWTYKQHEVIIEAFAKAVRESGDERSRLVFTGVRGDPRKPDYSADIERFIAQLGLIERVHYIGHIDSQLQWALIRHAEALVQASLGESVPGVSGVMEAVRLGTPVIASDIPANREVALGQLSLFPPGRVDRLAELVRAHFREPPRRRPMSTAEADAVNLEAGIQVSQVLRRFARQA